MSAERVLIDGRAIPGGVSPLDRGLQFGDGLFETIACRRGKARLLTLHLERLGSGCTRLGIRAIDSNRLRAEIEALIHDVDAAVVKLILTRGEALARGYAASGEERPTRILIRYPWPNEDPQRCRAGVRTGVAAVRLGENPALAGLKHLNRLEQVLAQAELRQRGLDELLTFSRSGKLISGTMTNVFIVQRDKLRTPRLDLCGVAGIMRRVVLREAQRAGLAAEECELGAADLDAAEEIFLTNARIGVWPVRRLETRDLSPGPITQRLQGLIEPLLEEPADA